MFFLAGDSFTVNNDHNEKVNVPPHWSMCYLIANVKYTFSDRVYVYFASRHNDVNCGVAKLSYGLVLYYVCSNIQFFITVGK